MCSLAPQISQDLLYIVQLMNFYLGVSYVNSKQPKNPCENESHMNEKNCYVLRVYSSLFPKPVYTHQ